MLRDRRSILSGGRDSSRSTGFFTVTWCKPRRAAQRYFGSMKRLFELRLSETRWLFPAPGDWEDLCGGAISEIDGFPVLDSKVFARTMHYALERGAATTDKVLSGLVLLSWHKTKKWWPGMLLWPDGVPMKNGQVFVSDAPEPFVVYFHKFKCFDCGLTLDGYAVSRDAYRFPEFLQVLKRVKPYEKRCPRCNGDMRHPLLIEIFHVH